MRIAIMLRTLDEKGGIGVYTTNLVEHLLALDRRNQYLLLYRDAGNVGRYAHHPNVTERVVRARGKALWDQVAVPLALWRGRADVVLHPKFTVPLLSPVPSIMVLHGADWWLPEAVHFYTRLDRLYLSVFMPLYLRRASAALSVSELTTQHFNRIFDLPPGKVRTTYFGPASHFRPVQDRGTLDRVKRRYALPDRFILTLSKGAGGERKNFRGILKAYERLHGAVPHSLVVVGKGCERFRGDYEIPDVGWGTRVRFPGWVEQEDLPAVYTLADVFLYPSNMEAFPIPLTEAMACGKAIVTSSVNGLREIAGDAALLVDPADADAVAGAVASVLVNEHLRETLESASLERARSFSWDACARQTLDALEEVASRRRTRGSPRRGRNRSEGLEAGAQ